MAQVIGVGFPARKERRGSMIKQFPGGRGDNNCPRFWYVRDGFGCIFDCEYCYLQRFASTHELGAELDPNVDELLRQVDAWMQRPGPLGLILGEVTDAWGWEATLQDIIVLRNLRLIERFRLQRTKTLIFLTKAVRVAQRLASVPPSPQVVLSWSVNAGAVAARYEMGAQQAQRRLRDAALCRAAGWRVRVRIDPMIPCEGWSASYQNLLDQVRDEVRPEQVTMGSWRPRPRDLMYRQAGAELREMLEAGPDGRLRLRNRVEMYRQVFTALSGTGMQISLCKEELDVQDQLYAEFGITEQACNCLGAAVAPVAVAPVSSSQRRLPVVT